MPPEPAESAALVSPHAASATATGTTASRERVQRRALRLVGMGPRRGNGARAPTRLLSGRRRGRAPGMEKGGGQADGQRVLLSNPWSKWRRATRRGSGGTGEKITHTHPTTLVGICPTL